MWLCRALSLHGHVFYSMVLIACCRVSHSCVRDGTPTPEGVVPGASPVPLSASWSAATITGCELPHGERLRPLRPPSALASAPCVHSRCCSDSWPTAPCVTRHECKTPRIVMTRGASCCEALRVARPSRRRPSSWQPRPDSASVPKVRPCAGGWTAASLPPVRLHGRTAERVPASWDVRG